MSSERPLRMKHDPKLGQHLRALDDPMTAARLAANADVVSRRIAAGAELAAPAATGWPKWILPGLLALGVGGYVWRVGQGAAGPKTDTATRAAVNKVEIGTKAEVQTDRSERDAPDRIGTAAPSPTKVAPPRRSAAPWKTPVASHTPPLVPHSDLPEQLRLFEKAKQTGARGNYDEALQVLAELVTRFPDTPLRPDAKLTELELLMKSEQNQRAIALLTELSEAPAHLGRRGELLRFLGDLYRKTGDCAGARAAYERALTGALSKRNATAVRRGLAQCAQR